MSKDMPESARSILNWVLAIGIITFLLLVLVIIFGNLSGNTGFEQASTQFYNETINLTTDGNTPTGASNRINGVITNVVMTNETDPEIVNSADYTIDGVVISSTAEGWNNSNVNVTYLVSYDGQAELDAENIITNYTQSAVNTSSQFPTVGTILGIAVLLLILIALLIFVVRRMMGVTITSGSSSSKFSGTSQGFG